eukprot:COSAG06_NODE_4757_length_3979_cov_1.884794_5_plen_47_part_00
MSSIQSEQQPETDGRSMGLSVALPTGPGVIAFRGGRRHGHRKLKLR